MAVLACGLCVRAGEAVQIAVQAVAAQLAVAGALRALALQHSMTQSKASSYATFLMCVLCKRRGASTGWGTGSGGAADGGGHVAGSGRRAARGHARQHGAAA